MMLCSVEQGIESRRTSVKEIAGPMPNPEILVEGNQTIIRNFSAIVDAMDRDANHVYQYLINELEHLGPENKLCNAQRSNPTKENQRKGVGYVKTYILCDQCIIYLILVSSRKVVPPCLSARPAVLPAGSSLSLSWIFSRVIQP